MTGGLDPNRVAEVLTKGPAGTPDGRASGYRITGAVVLTAEHAVRGRVGITVRFNADHSDEWSVPAAVLWSNPGEHGALLLLTLPPSASAVRPAEYGRVGDRPAVISDALTVGFPWWKLRPGSSAGSRAPGRYRDMHQAVCVISTLSGRRSHTLELTTSPPERRVEPGRSPWEGMSGAAVWVHDRVVGLVREHALAEGPNHLTATRIERLIDAMPPEVRQALSVDDLDQVVDVLEIGASQQPAASAAAQAQARVSENVRQSLLGAAGNAAIGVAAWLAGEKSGRKDRSAHTRASSARPDDTGDQTQDGDPLAEMDGDPGDWLDFDV